ncbi:MAG: hypothetical protein ABIH34_08365 [Nanoarchaeota archaeon]
MVWETVFKGLLFIFIVIVTSLPTWLAVHAVGKKTSILKVFFANILVGIFFSVIIIRFPVWGWFIGFITLLLIYRVMFDIGWIRSLLVWIVQLFFVVLILLIFVLLGLNTGTFSGLMAWLPF